MLEVAAIALVLVEGIYVGHFPIAKCEVKDLQILTDAPGVGGARDGDDALLHNPAQHDLSYCLSMSGADFFQPLVAHDGTYEVAAPEGGIGLHLNVVLLAESHNLLHGVEGMEFYLVQHGVFSAGFVQSPKLLDIEVGYSDCLYPPPPGTNQSAPCKPWCSRRRESAVNRGQGSLSRICGKPACRLFAPTPGQGAAICGGRYIGFLVSLT